VTGSFLDELERYQADDEIDVFIPAVLHLCASRCLVPRNLIVIPSTDERFPNPCLISGEWLPIDGPDLRSRIRVADTCSLSDVPNANGRIGATRQDISRVTRDSEGCAYPEQSNLLSGLAPTERTQLE
jgi:hypothetical protein